MMEAAAASRSFLCSGCNVSLPRDKFTAKQFSKGPKKCCLDCVASALSSALKCSGCERSLLLSHFDSTERGKGASAKCMSCKAKAPQQVSAPLLSIGNADVSCPSLGFVGTVADFDLSAVTPWAETIATTISVAAGAGAGGASALPTTATAVGGTLSKTAQRLLRFEGRLLECWDCCIFLQPSEFTNKQLVKGRERRCRHCVGEAIGRAHRRCARCDVDKPAIHFSKEQLDIIEDDPAICKLCEAAVAPDTVHSMVRCSACNNEKAIACFSRAQLHHQAFGSCICTACVERRQRTLWCCACSRQRKPQAHFAPAEVAKGRAAKCNACLALGAVAVEQRRARRTAVRRSQERRAAEQRQFEARAAQRRRQRQEEHRQRAQAAAAAAAARVAASEAARVAGQPNYAHVPDFAALKAALGLKSCAICLSDLDHSQLSAENLAKLSESEKAEIKTHPKAAEPDIDEDYSGKGVVMAKPCDHVYHRPCFAQMIAAERQNSSYYYVSRPVQCAMCRGQLQRV